MKDVLDWSKIYSESLVSFGENLGVVLQSLLGALLILIIGWMIAKFLKWLVTKALKTLKFDALMDKVEATEYLKKGNVGKTPSQLVGMFAYWALMLFVVMTAADSAGWNAASGEISNLISFLPKLLLAIFFFIVGAYIAKFVKGVLQGGLTSFGIATGSLVSNFAFYLIMIIVALTSLRLTGLDTSIVNNNLLIILAGIVAAAVISYSLASRNAMANIVSGYFSKNLYSVGMKVSVGDITGTIAETTNMGVIIDTHNGNRVVIPTAKLIDSQVTIHG